MKLVLLTGASGAGKTALVQALNELRLGWVVGINCDARAEVPIEDQVTELRGAPDPIEVAVIDTQMAPDHSVGIWAPRMGGARVVLVQCHEDVRHERLRRRGQPDLVHSDMDHWASYMSGQGDVLRLTVINTTRASLAESTAQLVSLAGELRALALPPVMIRKASASDREALVACDPQAVPGSSRRRFIEERLRQDRCWVAELDDRLGFEVLEDSFFGQGFVSLLIVQPELRRRGVGRALLAHALSVCSTPKLFTSTNESNTAMRALLRKMAFEPSGVIHNLDPGDPELLFSRMKE
jgi:ribosomal protein S18 acetylase RimI-like enzyme